MERNGLGSVGRILGLFAVVAIAQQLPVQDAWASIQNPCCGPSTACDGCIPYPGQTNQYVDAGTGNMLKQCTLSSGVPSGGLCYDGSPNGPCKVLNNTNVYTDSACTILLTTATQVSIYKPDCSMHSTYNCP